MVQVSFAEEDAAQVVETTSYAAARALAEIYRATGETEETTGVNVQGYITQRREGDKVIYRIKPRPNSLEQQKRSLSSNALATPSKKRGLRMARSNPQLRPPNIKILPIMPDNEGFFRPPLSDSSQHQQDGIPVPTSAHHILPRGTSTLPAPVALNRHRAASIPGLTLSSPDNLDARGVYRDRKSYGDVLSSILGWSDTLAESAADQRLPQSDAGPSSPPPPTPTMTLSLAVADLSTPQKEAPLPRSKSSPFGESVKLPASSPTRETRRGRRGSLTRLFNAPAPPMARPTSKTRFQDPYIFDVLQAAETSGPSLTTSPSLDSHDGLDRHSRMPSTSSLVSSSSRATAHQITVTQASGDDPRFVIWGLKQAKAGATPPGLTRRWSVSRRNSVSDASSTKRESKSSSGTAAAGQRILMAATIERWVAELTSKIESDLLADFFLTYRLFISPLELCQLLITRFEWAVAEPLSPEDEAGRRIVRVRTFVVLRHWLLNYFVEDFVHDSALRSLLTGWLNTMARSSRIKSSESDQRLIKGLKKVVKRLKQSYSTIGALEAQGAAQLLAALGAPSSFGDGRSDQPRNFTDPRALTDDEVDLEIEASSRARGPGSRPFIPNSPPRIRVREQHRDLPNSPPQASSDHLPPHLDQHGSVSRAVSSTVSRFKRLMHRPASSVLQGKRESPYDDPKFSSLSEAQLVSDHGHCSPSLLHSSLASPTSSSGLQTSSESDFRSSSTSVESNTSVDGLGISQDQPTALRHSQSSQTIKTDSKQAPRLWSLSRVSYASGVQLDDVGFSDDSDEELGEDFPRTLRRLPAARDLRHANALRHLHSNLKVAHSSDSMSSAGTTREPPHLFFQPTSSSRASQASESSEYGGPGPAVILNFVVDGLESDEEEDAGDVEAALRRLEGQIDGDRQKQNAVKVEEQMAKSKARAEHGDTDEIIEEDDGCYSDSPMSPVEEVEAHPAAQEPRLSTVVLPPRSNLQAVQSKSRLSAFRNSIGRKPSVKALARGSMSKASDSRLGMPSLVRSLADPPHRSFVLFCKTTQLAKQFALIERDLFCNIGWHELLHGTWRKQSMQSEVGDWERYIKERARMLVAARLAGQTLEPSEVSVAIARFNLVANWCTSEVVMTPQLDERAALISKFIRLAWKCYRHSNFQTLTQLIHGLQSVFVERLAKTWARVPTWEQRVFKDLKMLTSHVGNFRSLRAASNQLSDSWGPPGQKTTASAPVETPPTSRRASVSVTAKGAKKSTQPAVVGCIPFLGLYLRDLTTTGELPTYLDPSCPSAEAMRDGQSGLLISLNQPFAFVDLTPLDSAHLYPLVNVHKARLMACTMQKVLIFQEMASTYSWEADPILFRKCLAIKALSTQELQQFSYRAEADRPRD